MAGRNSSDGQARRLRDRKMRRLPSRTVREIKQRAGATSWRAIMDARAGVGVQWFQLSRQHVAWSKTAGRAT